MTFLLKKKNSNAGFATYVEYLGVEAVQPQIRLLEQFIISEVQVRIKKKVPTYEVAQKSGKRGGFLSEIKLEKVVGTLKSM